jgi:hypothetical protein
VPEAGRAAERQSGDVENPHGCRFAAPPEYAGALMR